MKDCCACKLESRNDPLGEAADFKNPGARRTPPDLGHPTVSVESGAGSQGWCQCAHGFTVCYFLEGMHPQS